MRRLGGFSDYSRWSNAKNLEKWWETRTRQIAEFIPAGSTVLEFGAGSCCLKAFLDKSCEYVPSDIVKRGPDTLICDLNERPLPELSHVKANVAVFAGVLEYVGDIETVAAWLSQFVALCIVSYDCVPSGLKLYGRQRERFRRMYFGYLSDLTEDQLQRAFRRHGFVNTRMDTWTTQRILVFARESIGVPPPLSAKVASVQRLGISQ
jgi:hypothetical protein